MSWNYRVMGIDITDDEMYYHIHEVYYNDDGTPRAYTQNPVTVNGESPEEIKLVLERMLEAVKKPAIFKGSKFPQEIDVIDKQHSESA